MRGSASFGMPRPVSRTVATIRSRAAAGKPPGSSEDQQVSDDFGSAVRLAVDDPDLPAQLLREGAGHPQQLEMPQHALEGIVQFVGDPRNELPQRGELLRLGQPLAELL